MTPLNAVLESLVFVVIAVAAYGAAAEFPQALHPWPSIAWAILPIAAVLFFALDRVLWANDGTYLRNFVREKLAAEEVKAAG